MSSRLIWVAAILFGSAPGHAAPAHVWKAYVNARYQYSVCFPADLLTPQPEAPDGDGRVFTGHGATLRAFGSPVAEPTAAGAKAAGAKAAGARLAGRAGRVTYTAVKPMWFVVSGTNDTNAFYAKTLYGSDAVRSFELIYPASAAPTWDVIAASLNACFHRTAPAS